MSALWRDTRNTSRPHPQASRPGGAWLIALAALFVTFAAQPVFAQFPTREGSPTRVTEFDLPVQADGRPGAIAIEPNISSHSNAVWFVTREISPRVYRLTVPRNLKSGSAPWKSWPLHELGLGPTGGVKKLRTSWDRRFVFIRTINGLNKVDTVDNRVTFYPDTVFNLVSDLSVDQSNRVFFAARSEGIEVSPTDPTQVVPIGETGFIKRINASYHCSKDPCPAVDAITWQVGGGVGNCVGGVTGTDPCLSGIAVHPKIQNLVYYADNQENYIGELDTSTNSKSCNCPFMTSKTRRWKLSALGSEVNQPRQLNIDNDGIVWVVTGSGHLVSLNPKTNKMTKHQIPSPVVTDPFGVAPDGGVVGYTDNQGAVNHKVAMLIPRNNAVVCPPDVVYVPRDTENIQPDCADIIPTDNVTSPIRRKVPSQITSKGDGTFVEALVDQNAPMETSTRSSRLPLGITPDRERSKGAFFYAVGEAESLIINRIGHTRLPRKGEKVKEDRDDEDIDDDGKPRGMDDDDDDDGMKNDIDNDDDDDGIMDIEDDDDDNDGIKNEHDTKNAQESQSNYSSQLAASQFEQFEVTTLPNALALIVLAVADNPLVPISIEIRNAAGQLVGTSVAAPGAGLITLVTPAAGIYTVQLKNHGALPVGITTSMITRDPRP